MCIQAIASTYTMCIQALASTYTMCIQALPSDNNSVWVIAIQYNKTRSLKYNKQVLNWYICIAYKLLTLSN